MNRSVLFVLGGAIVVVVLFLVFRSSDDKSSTAATTTSTTTPTSTTAVPPSRVLIAIRVAKARPVGGIRHAEVKQGKKVSLVVTSPDTTDEVHLHGYDLHSDIEDGRAQIDFTATIAGRFEAELEDHGVQILDLEVTP